MTVGQGWLSRGARGAFMCCALLAGAVLCPRDADAFCGFYVAGSGAQLQNSGTHVVLMRIGTLTVLSMQNDYSGPPADFAMVVPVPVVLQADDVRTLPRDVFDRVNALSAPRLVEYWEQDPCASATTAHTSSMSHSIDDLLGRAVAPQPVQVHARFAVGEYDVVVLGAGDSAALEQWLRAHGYRIPDGAAAILRPYVQQGMKFFVAKVDASRVRFVGGRAVLSPLRIAYASQGFSLPVRLGLLNSSGEQDLIVHILAESRRYEVANYPNVTIPTNLEVQDRTRSAFGSFYEALFRETLAASPGAVVTEYAWSAGSCDPCPGGVMGLSSSDLQTLGMDVLGPSYNLSAYQSRVVLTRLHHRYAPTVLGEDLVFRVGLPIQGGREDTPGNGASVGGVNAFQARYIIRHPYGGRIACDNPRRNMWGPPPSRGWGAATPVVPPGLGAERPAAAASSHSFRGSGTPWRTARHARARP